MTIKWFLVRFKDHLNGQLRTQLWPEDRPHQKRPAKEATAGDPDIISSTPVSDEDINLSFAELEAKYLAGLK